MQVSGGRSQYLAVTKAAMLMLSLRNTKGTTMDIYQNINMVCRGFPVATQGTAKENTQKKTFFLQAAIEK